MNENEYLQHLEHCLALAERAPTETVRASFLRMARLFETEARLLQSAVLRISESRAAIAKANGLLGTLQTEQPIQSAAPKHRNGALFESAR